MNRSQAKLPVDVDVVDVVVEVDLLCGVAKPRLSWLLSAELVKANTVQTTVETADVTLVEPVPERLPQARFSYGDEREQRVEVLLAPVSRDIESASHEVADAPFDSSAAYG